MQPGAERLARALERVEVRRPSVPVISNVTARATSDPAEIRENLVAQVTSPVRFTDCVAAAKALGVRAVVEVGPGRVLAGLVKRIDPELETHAADTADAVDALAATSTPLGGTP
jgi:[acyl-carrier-protein] S-malonyltransferase